MASTSTTAVPSLIPTAIPPSAPVAVARAAAAVVADAAAVAASTAVSVSSAASAANAAIDTVRTLVTPTPEGQWFSVGVCSDGSYGTPKGIITSLPVRSDGKNWEVVQGLEINEFSRGKIDASNKELLDEQAAVKQIFSL